MMKSFLTALVSLLGVMLVAGVCLAQTAARNPSDQVLEIAPSRPLPPPPPAEATPPPASSDQGSGGESATPGSDDVSLYKSYFGDQSYQPYFQRERPPDAPAPVSGAMPYLGIGVKPQSVMSKGGELHGLEVLSVDPNSPAAAAGLKPVSNPTEIGTSGATAGALLGPAEFLMVPLLKKTGQLGRDGDLIVAADDQRVATEQDLAGELSKLKPGDTLWLTVMRDTSSSRPQSVRVAVHLGQIHQVAGAR